MSRRPFFKWGLLTASLWSNLLCSCCCISYKPVSGPRRSDSSLPCSDTSCRWLQTFKMGVASGCLLRWTCCQYLALWTWRVSHLFKNQNKWVFLLNLKCGLVFKSFFPKRSGRLEHYLQGSQDQRSRSFGEDYSTAVTKCYIAGVQVNPRWCLCEHLQDG